MRKARCARALKIQTAGWLVTVSLGFAFLPNSQAQGLFLTGDGELHVPSRQRSLVVIDDSGWRLHVQASSYPENESVFWIVPLPELPNTVDTSSANQLNALSKATDYYVCEWIIDSCDGAARNSMYPLGRMFLLDHTETINMEYMKKFDHKREFREWFGDFGVIPATAMLNLADDYIKRGYVFYVAVVESRGGSRLPFHGLPPKVFDWSQNENIVLPLGWLSAEAKPTNGELSIMIGDHRHLWKPNPFGNYRAASVHYKTNEDDHGQAFEDWLERQGGYVLAELFNADITRRTSLGASSGDAILEPCRTRSDSWGLFDLSRTVGGRLDEFVRNKSFFTSYYRSFEATKHMVDLKLVPDKSPQAYNEGRTIVEKFNPCEEEPLEPASSSSRSSSSTGNDPWKCETSECSCIECAPYEHYLCKWNCSDSWLDDSSGCHEDDEEDDDDWEAEDSGCHQDDYEEEEDDLWDDDDDTGCHQDDYEEEEDDTGCHQDDEEEEYEWDDSESGCSGYEEEETTYDESGGCIDAEDDDEYLDEGCSSMRRRFRSRRFRGNSLCIMLAFGVVFGRRIRFRRLQPQGSGESSNSQT